MPRAHGEITQDDIPALTNKIGVKSRVSKKSLRFLHENDKPLILLLKNNQACVLLPAKTHQGKIYFPEEGITDKHIDQLKDEFTGYVIILDPGAGDTRTLFSNWIWGPVTTYWDRFLEVILASAFINMFALALPLFSMNVYDSVVPNFALDTLIVLAVGIFLALAFDFLFKILRNHILEGLSSKIGAQFDFELMQRLLAIPQIDLNMAVGQKANLFKEIQGLRDFYTTKLGPAMVDFPFFLLFIFVIGTINLKIVLVPICAAIFILTLTFLMQNAIKSKTSRNFKEMQGKSSLLIETLEGSETLRMLSATGTGLFKWAIATETAADAAKESNTLMAWNQNASLSAMYVVNVLVIIIGVYEIHAGALTVGGLIACTILSSRALAPIMALSGTLTQMKKSYDVLQTIKKIFDLRYEGETTNKIQESAKIKGKITLRDVTYYYPGQSVPALEGVSFEINPGEKVGIIGKTGAGKSTITKILNGFVRPVSGNILIDHQVLDSYHPAQFRAHVGTIPQKSFFFSGSLRENITMGREHISEERFREVIKLSGLEYFLEQTSRGFDTEIGENGERLSGGQQQSIALARALLHDPEILIFDEPTNGMDQNLERQMQDTFATYLKDKTLILITHRTPLLKLVDRLILIDRGRIVADGPRDDILQKLGGGTGA